MSMYEHNYQFLRETWTQKHEHVWTQPTSSWGEPEHRNMSMYEHNLPVLEGEPEHRNMSKYEHNLPVLDGNLNIETWACMNTTYQFLRGTWTQKHEHVWTQPTSSWEEPEHRNMSVYEHNQLVLEGNLNDISLERW